MKVDRIRVTSATTFLDSIDLRKALRDYEGGSEASFLPGINALPETRPSFVPPSDDKRELPPMFRKYAKMVCKLFYPEQVPVCTQSYGIRKEAKMGLPYNSNSEEAHLDVIRRLLHGGFGLEYAGEYVYGTRRQTDSGKVRFTGYTQLGAIGDGFWAQRHREINCGPAINHLEGLYEFDYHHNFITKYAATFNVVVDEFFEKECYAYAWDYKHFERSLGWDVIHEESYNRLCEIGRYRHAEIYRAMNMGCKIHYRPAFSSRAKFDEYLRASIDENTYCQTVRKLYGISFAPDDNVRKTIEDMKLHRAEMEATFEREQSDPKSIIAGYKVYSEDRELNNSGNSNTASDGKKLAVTDYMCRTDMVYGIKWTEEMLDSFLLGKLDWKLSNLGDDNMERTRKPFKFQEFLECVTGCHMTEEQPVSFLSRLLTGEVSPRHYKNATLMPQAKSFFRKLSRENDVFSYLKPSIGWVESLKYAKRNKKFSEHEREIYALFSRLYMPIEDIIDDLRACVDKPLPDMPIDVMEYLDDPGKIYKNPGVDAVATAPELFYAIKPEDRLKIIEKDGVTNGGRKG